MRYPRIPAWSGLALAALGVVYGICGTALYAFKEAFAGAHGIDPSKAMALLATLSAFF